MHASPSPPYPFVTENTPPHTQLNNLTSNGPLPLHVYGILYDTGLDTGFSRSFFEDIANQTSGKAYPFANQTSLQTIYEEIALYF